MRDGHPSETDELVQLRAEQRRILRELPGICLWLLPPTDGQHLPPIDRAAAELELREVAATATSVARQHTFVTCTVLADELAGDGYRDARLG